MRTFASSYARMRRTRRRRRTCQSENAVGASSFAAASSIKIADLIRFISRRSSASQGRAERQTVSFPRKAPLSVAWALHIKIYGREVIQYDSTLFPSWGPLSLCIATVRSDRAQRYPAIKEMSKQSSNNGIS